MQKKIYHHGLILRTLREIKGLKEKELAEAIGCEFDNILLWEEEGIPDKELSSILDFFEVSKSLFSAEILNDSMLKAFVLNELQRPALKEELSNRLSNYSKRGSGELDLSSLGLTAVPDIIFTLPDLKKVDLSDNLLIEIPRKLQSFIADGCELIIKNNFIDPALPNTYNTVAKKLIKKLDSKDLLIEKIRFVQLRLEHIGIYEDLIIDFNDELTVLIGVNGAGKTTILKALSLAVLGARDSVKHKAVSLRSIDIPNKTDSIITLKATVDGIEYSNQITLIHDSDTSEIHIKGKPFEQLYSSSSAIKNLILCLGEQRNNSNVNEKQNVENNPRILDLLPLLRGDDQSCMTDFTAWWANLENSKIENPNDQNTINLCFEIFSKFMDENIQSGGLRKVKPNTELWLKYSTGKSTPFHLASQGYQSVMGWVGFIIQRMIEANEEYPLPLSQPSIVIIDEIDQLLSIKWQQKILPILKSFFPNTQWIISTHSPMVLTDLKKHQVVQLHERDGNIIAESNEVDLWMWQYGDIIRRYFEISTSVPKYQEQDLELEIDRLHKTPVNERKEDFNNTLNDKKNLLLKVQKSRAEVDPVYQQQLNLHLREQELQKLITDIKNKIKS